MNILRLVKGDTVATIKRNDKGVEYTVKNGQEKQTEQVETTQAGGFHAMSSVLQSLLKKGFVIDEII